MTNLTSDVDCTALPFNFTDAPGPANQTDTFYIADTLPPNGTQALSDNPGDLTTPISGETLTWSLFDGSPTIATAVPYNAQAAASTVAGAAPSGSGGGTATPTGGAVGSTTKSGVMRVTGDATRAICIAMVVGFLLLG